MSEWREYKIEDIATLSNGINFGKAAYSKGIKLVGVSDFSINHRLFHSLG